MPSESMPGQFTIEGTNARLGLFAGGIARARRDRSRPGLRVMAWLVTALVVFMLLSFAVMVISQLVR